MNRIELLGPKLLRNELVLKEIDHWLAVMDRPNGWHYDLDIVWLLKNLEQFGMKAGMTILDAGAGLGVTQYVLAARGYRIISLDYAQRDSPRRAEGIFEIRHAQVPPLDYQHPYMSHVDLVGGSRNLGTVLRKVATRFAANPTAATLAMGDAGRRLKRVVANLTEKRRDHSHYGSIEFMQASFHNLPIPDKSVDAVVSVSAIEHSEKDIIARALLEIRRVVRPGSPILITTSATGEHQDVFHQQTQGYCFTRESLLSLVGEQCECAFDHDRVEQELLNCERLWSRLDPYYYRWESSLFHGRQRVRSLPYVPVGIRIQSSG